MLLDDFFTEYWPREETLEEVWGWVLGRTHGHLHLAGPAGCGKSWLVRGLAVGAQERGALPLYLEKSHDESFTSLIWRLVDSTEFMLDIDGESLRLVVSQALYEKSPPEALLAIMTWLTQEVDGSFLILFDGFDEAAELAELPPWRDFPKGVYLISSGRARHPGDQLVLKPEHGRNLSELEAHLHKHLPAEQQEEVAQILALTQGNWRWAYYYTLLLKLGVKPLPQPNLIFEALLEALSKKHGPELFRTIHLEVLLLLAVAQVPASLELLKAWGLPPDQLGFALFELRDLMSSDGEGSQYDALFTGEHYSLRSPDLRAYLLDNPAWRDRVSDCHRRAVATALERRPVVSSGDMPQDADFYARAFAQYHLHESGRLGDLNRLMQDPDTVEHCWSLGRVAREQGYEEIGLQLFLVAGQILESQRTHRSKRSLAQLVEIYADCCHALTNQGRYSDGAHFGEQALEILRPMLSQDNNDPLEALLTHCLLCLADPYLYMGYVQRAYPLYAEAFERSSKEQGPEQAKAIHALRGLARSARALGKTQESLRHGLEALELARKLTREEGEEWAQYLFELLMEQSETMRTVRETMTEPPGPLELMGMRWESLRLLREAEEQYHRFQWPGDQELVFLYLEQSMALFDLEKWAEAEERLSKAIEVINTLPAGDSHPADLASLEFLRSHALALMNRIGEASGSLANLLTPELMAEMDISEQALVLFFRAKILSHQGLLRQAETALEDSIAAYQQAIGLGAEDLFLEQLSAKIYLARVTARRGRLEEALDLCHECYHQLLDLDNEEGPPSLEVADVSELEAWIFQSLGRWQEGLLACDRAFDALEHIRGTESEADVETEHSLNLITRALNLSGLHRHHEAVQLADQAVEMEQRRAQEGYEQANMWCAIHRLNLAKLCRQANLPGKAVTVARQAFSDLSGLPANQQNHLGLHLAAVQMEIALALIQLEQWNQVRDPLQQACALYENEMWQGKEYLVAVLLDCQRNWLDFCRLSSNSDWQDRSCWKLFFEGWTRWQAHIKEEADNVFLIHAQERLKGWVHSLPDSLQQEWNAAAPPGLRIETPI
ncbi:hypothetical protein IV102_20145 [bacterium]|nr:hypothetical protein [bacterium]